MAARDGASLAGKHHYLVAKADQKERVLDTFVKMVTAQPPRAGRGGPRAGAGLPERRSRWSLRPSLLHYCSDIRRASTDRTSSRELSGQSSPGTCATCHNAQLLSGGMNVAELASAESLTSHRESWEKILQRLRAGDMPPSGAARPAAADLTAMTSTSSARSSAPMRPRSPTPGG